MQQTCTTAMINTTATSFNSNDFFLLVVDDDFAIRQLLCDFLTSHGFRCCAAANAAEARTHLANQQFDLIILDYMMPGESGVDFARTLRETNMIPILLLTAKDALDDKLSAFDAGADDYITKPIEPLELIARIKSHLKKKTLIQPIATLVTFADFEFNLETGMLTQHNNQITLTSSERLLLRLLAGRINHPYPREELAQKIGHRVSERSVDVQINRLRHKLKSLSPNFDPIQTIRHQGYALISTS